jgi:ferric enterobactin receptor
MFQFRFALAIIIFLPFYTVYAQFPMMGGMNQGPKIAGKITGTLLDANTNQPVEFATVALTKKGSKKIVNGTVTDEKGNFKLEKVYNDTYTITFSFLGYNPLILDSVSTTLKKPDLNLGKLKIKPSETLLKEVEIKGEAELIENKVDRIVYNAEKDITAAGGDATDVLRKVPMLSVDNDGNVQLMGSGSVRILINNKPSGMMANSIADALRMIPADQIKSVEVITSPSAKYDAEGSAGIINIITKKKEMEGINGTVSASAGTRNNSLNYNMGIKRGRLSINTGLGGSYFIPRKGFTEFYREDFVNNESRILSQKGDFFGSRNGLNGNFGVEYDINAYNSISSTVKLGSFGYRGENQVDVNYTDNVNDFSQIYSRYSKVPTQTTNIDWTNDYRKTFKKQGQELSTSFQLIQSISDNRYNMEQIGAFNLKERSENDGKNREMTFQTDYAHPLHKNLNYETGVKGIFRNISSNSLYEVFNFNTNNYLNDTLRSNFFDFNQNILAYYNQLGIKIGSNYDFRVGARLEHTSNYYLNYNVPNQIYYNVLPNAILSRTFKNFSTLKFSFNQRIQRPGLFYLNPFINANDPRNVTQGNPLLNPELSNNFELTYGKFANKVSFSTTVFHRFTTNVIQNYSNVNDFGATVTSYQNIGKNQTTGASAFGQITIIEPLTVRGFLNVMYVQIDGIFNNQKLQNDGIQYNANINITYKIGKGYAFEYFGMLNSQRVTIQGLNPSMSFMNVGGKKQILKDKGSVGFSITNPFNRYVKFSTETKSSSFNQTSVNAIPFRAFSINFSYNFGKVEFRNPRQKKRGVSNDDIKQGEGTGF